MKKLLIIMACLCVPASMTFAGGYSMGTSTTKTTPTFITENTTTTIVPKQVKGVSFGSAVLGRDCFNWASCRQLQRKMDRGATTTAPVITTRRRTSARSSRTTNPRLRYHNMMNRR